MPRVDCLKSVPIRRTARVMQLEGLFDVPPAARSEVRLTAELPIDDKPWTIGLIVGPSGSGKTTIARELFGKAATAAYSWPADASLVDGFPQQMGIREITHLLSSVGFSSPPSWLRPYHVLSTGEQFRATIARALAEASAERGTRNAELKDGASSVAPSSALRVPRSLPPVVIDEFTSVVDRTVAKIGSAAIAKAVRRTNQRFVAVSCHYDIVDWLCPDWVYETGSGSFQWRCERRRPAIELEIARVHSSAWRVFHRHHYLSATLHRGAKCFVAFVDGQPAAFTAVLSFPHPVRPCWREHRTVCLPDFQGVGIGNALSEFVAGMFKATGKPYYSTTSNPAMIQHRARSSLWRMARKPSMVRNRRHAGLKQVNFASSFGRITAGFEYVGAVGAVSASLIARLTGRQSTLVADTGTRRRGEMTTRSALRVPRFIHSAMRKLNTEY